MLKKKTKWPHFLIMTPVLYMGGVSQLAITAIRRLFSAEVALSQRFLIVLGSWAVRVGPGGNCCNLGTVFWTRGSETRRTCFCPGFHCCWAPHKQQTASLSCLPLMKNSQDISRLILSRVPFHYTNTHVPRHHYVTFIFIKSITGSEQKPKGWLFHDHQENMLHSNINERREELTSSEIGTWKNWRSRRSGLQSWVNGHSECSALWGNGSDTLMGLNYSCATGRWQRRSGTHHQS